MPGNKQGGSEAPAKAVEIAVALRAVRKAFGGTEVIHGVDAEIAAGEFVVLVGPSGAGKTTLLRLVAGLDKPTAGEILMQGRVVNSLPAKDRDIAMVFQQYALYPHLTVRENLAFSLRMRNEGRRVIAQRVAEAAAILDLGACLDRYPAQLSGGQQQRVAIGRAIVRKPQLFLFDEPLSNLDGALRTQMRTEIKGLHRRLGATSLYVTHDQAEAMAMADRIIVLRHGGVEQAGTPLELYDRPANLFVAGFIGTPPMNLVPAKVFGDERPIIYGFRPESCTIDTADGLPARVTGVEYLGATQNVYLELSSTLVCAMSTQRNAWRPGQLVHLRLDPARLQYFDAVSGRALEESAVGGRRSAVGQ
ncbi:MAG TPA: ABC transporter ATP-binding protein [Burkholderiaceae bacterium]|nr:ABC transporter ATP-binding protein [Burkholderiaceae bacterium]